MKAAGIIAEYNPFHLGHEYHIRQTREATGADYIVVIMSGNFTQRGQAALMDKYGRARQALENGADLVLELPVCFATASAKIFAFGGVSLLDKLGVIDCLSFGSENGRLEQIWQTALFFQKESEAYQTQLRLELKQGHSFPKARAIAMQKCCPGVNTDFLKQPNNILGVEYCNALLSLKSRITPVAIKRLHSSYHDPRLSEEGYSSATAIRQALDKALLLPLASHLPDSVHKMLLKEYGRTLPMGINDFSGLLHYRLLSEKRETLSLYADLHQDLADRIYHYLYSFRDYLSFCDLLKTKQLTHSRISRSLLHILLDIKENEIHQYKEGNYARYARILGFRKTSSHLLHKIKTNASIPLISKLADSPLDTDPLSAQMLKADIRAAHIYESVLSQKFQCAFRDEYRRQFPIL